MDDREIQASRVQHLIRVSNDLYVSFTRNLVPFDIFLERFDKLEQEIAECCEVFDNIDELEARLRRYFKFGGVVLDERVNYVLGHEQKHADAAAELGLRCKFLFFEDYRYDQVYFAAVYPYDFKKVCQEHNLGRGDVIRMVYMIASAPDGLSGFDEEVAGASEQALSVR